MNIAKKITCALIFHLILAFSLLPAETYAAAVLKINAQGKEVTALQKRLTALNYDITACDGIFGSETKKAVLAFQKNNKLKPTGIVDKKTQQALKKAKPLKKAPVKPAQPAKTLKAAETAPFVPQKQVPAILKTARQYIGVPYKYGGTTPKGFDCSGYIQYVFGQYKYDLPRSADVQYNIGKKTEPSALREGDLVFFSADRSTISHCGIYIGSGKFIHASSSKGIRIDELKDAYWKPLYTGAKRITK